MRVGDAQAEAQWTFSPYRPPGSAFSLQALFSVPTPRVRAPGPARLLVSPVEHPEAEAVLVSASRVVAQRAFQTVWSSGFRLVAWLALLSSFRRIRKDSFHPFTSLDFGKRVRIALSSSLVVCRPMSTFAYSLARWARCAESDETRCVAACTISAAALLIASSSF